MLLCCVRVDKGIVESWIGSCAGGLQMRYIRCGPSRIRMCVPAVIAGVTPDKGIPTACASAQAFDDDYYPISVDDDALLVMMTLLLVWVLQLPSMTLHLLSMTFSLPEAFLVIV